MRFKVEFLHPMLKRSERGGGARGGISLFTSIGAGAAGRFSTPLAVLHAHALLGALERVAAVAGELQFSSLQI